MTRSKSVSPTRRHALAPTRCRLLQQTLEIFVSPPPAARAVTVGVPSATARSENLRTPTSGSCGHGGRAVCNSLFREAACAPSLPWLTSLPNQGLLGFPKVGRDGVAHSQHIGPRGPWDPVSLCAETPFQPRLGDDACDRFLGDLLCVMYPLITTLKLSDDARFRESPPHSVSHRASDRAPVRSEPPLTRQPCF